MKIKLTLIHCVFFFLLVHAQTEIDLPVLTETDIPNGKILRTDYYDGTSLWGLINGGADLYLEYGFDKLLFQEVEIEDYNFRSEIYRMKDDKAAFGIFSVSRYKCETFDTLTKFICVTPYQVQAAVGKFYISIANEKGDNNGKLLTLNLFSKYLSKISQPSTVLPGFFERKSFEPYKNQLKYMRGRLGIQNGFPAWIEMFDQYNHYEIYLLPVERTAGYANISQIKFTSENEMHKFTEENKSGNENNLLRIIKPLSASEIRFIETNLSSENLRELLNSD